MKSLRLPLLAFEALDGSFTPSMANISRPMSPWRWQIMSTWVNTFATASPRLLTNVLSVLWSGWLSPESAMNCTLLRHAHSMPRELTIPRE